MIRTVLPYFIAVQAILFFIGARADRSKGELIMGAAFMIFAAVLWADALLPETLSIAICLLVLCAVVIGKIIWNREKRQQFQDWQRRQQASADNGHLDVHI